MHSAHAYTYATILLLGVGFVPAVWGSWCWSVSSRLEDAYDELVAGLGTVIASSL